MKHSTRLASVLSAAAALLLMASVGYSEDAAKPTGTAVITGKVTDSTGKAAAGLKVNLVAGEGPAKPQHTAKDAKPKGDKGGKMAPAMATATTDAEGAFKFDALAAGTYTVTAGGKGLGRGHATVTLTDGQTATADITLAMGGAGGKKPKAN